MYSDAHVHMEEALIKIWETTQVSSIINCTTVNECIQAKKLCAQYPFLNMSCGIHPWYANHITWQEMEPWLKDCVIIGEIGLDNVWCEVPIEKQRTMFMKQIAYAHTYKKPVILHTKGQEQEIAKIISAYPNTYLVHWYSSLKYLSLYQDLGCYFSVGPDLKDEAVQNVVENIAIDHLLIESDGIGAIAWARQCPSKQIDYLQTLHDSASYIANKKQLTIEDVLNYTKENLLRFQLGK